MPEIKKCPKCKGLVIGPFAHQTPDGKWHKRIQCLDTKKCKWHKHIGDDSKTAMDAHPVTFVDKKE